MKTKLRGSAETRFEAQQELFRLEEGDDTQTTRFPFDDNESDSETVSSDTEALPVSPQNITAGKRAALKKTLKAIENRAPSHRDSYSSVLMGINQRVGRGILRISKRTTMRNARGSKKNPKRKKKTIKKGKKTNSNKKKRTKRK